MDRVDTSSIAPPRLLGGVTVLFWGAMSGNALLGLLLAILLEGRNWVKLRWDFGEKGHVAAFQVCLVLVLFGMVLSWVDGAGQYSLLNMMQWAPVYALPVELAQRYGRQDSMYLNTFFYFSRRRMIQDRKEGREVDPMRMNTGYPFILLTLISAACSTPAYWLHVVGVILILLGCFVSVSVKRGVGWGGLVIAVPLMLAVGFGCQMLLLEVNDRFRNQDEPNSDWAENQGRMSEYRSRLGNLGDIKQSKEVMWRMWSEQRPEYLRFATYDVYGDGMWRYDYVGDGHESLQASFEADIASLVGEGDVLRNVFRQEDENRALTADERETVRVRGTVDTKSDTALVPSVSGFYAVGRALGDDVNAETNSMGTLRLVNRDVVIDYTMWAELGNNVQDSIPDSRDLELPYEDRDLIRRLVEEIGLKELKGAQEKVVAIRRYFTRNFIYATHFDTHLTGGGKSELARFLTDVKKGHCEYFATATALLLRESGVPARYCVGFAVREKKGDAYVIRGTDAHAWCRMFADGKWEDVDLTPPDWGEMDAALGELSAVEQFKSWLKLLREDFQVWRQDDSNKGEFWMIVGGLGLLIFGWIGFRLWRAKLSDVSSRGVDYWNGSVRETPLHRLEKEAAKVLGERPVGMPYGRWMGGLSGVVDGGDLERVIALHQGMRFDPLASAGEEELVELCLRMKSDLKRFKKGA